MIGWKRRFGVGPNTNTEVNMTVKEQTCAERVEEACGSLEDDLVEIMERVTSRRSDVADEAMTELYEYPLSIEVETRIKIVFSTGGPHTEVEWDHHRGNMIFRLIDWWDSASCRFDNEEAKRAIEFLVGDDPDYFVEQYLERTDR
jgi:hypothetical protein